MRLLLDTCAYLWIVSGAPDLSAPARSAFRDPANEAYLSVVSTWEIAIKHALGRLKLPLDPARFVPDQRERHGIASLPLHEAATLFLVRLPALHRDPFDRMLICQALTAGLTILTPDDLVRQYPVPTLW